MSRLSSSLSVVALGSFLAFCAGKSVSAQHSPAKAGPRHVPLGGKRVADAPVIAGVDGSTTGTASFLGNFTELATPDFTGFGFQRQPDCSLNFFSWAQSGSTYQTTITGASQHYEKILHNLGSVTTTPDLFPNGCTQTSNGIGSRAGVYVGQIPSGVDIFATVQPYSNQGANNALLVGSVSPSTYVTGPVNAYSSAALANGIALATGDLNGDGIGDLVVVNANLTTTGVIYVMLGNADGSFQAPVSYSTPGTQTVAASIDDVNGDGKLDIVVVSNDMNNPQTAYQQISVFLGNGDGTFQAAQSFVLPPVAGYAAEESAPIVNIITADLRGIGKKDIVGSNGLVMLGNGDGTFTALTAAAFPYELDDLYSQGPNLAAADINKDGKLDVVLNNSTSISTWLGNGDGTFTQGTAYASIGDVGYVTVSDLDGDGNLDIYSGLANGGFFTGDPHASDIYFLLGNGDGTFQGAPLVGASGTFTGNNVGDVTGSGKMDIITNGAGENGAPTAGFAVQLNNGKGLFTPTSTITAPASFVLDGSTVTTANTFAANAYAVGDLNGDGKADLAFVDVGLPATAGNEYILGVYFTALSNGDGTFQAVTPYAFPQIAPSNSFDISIGITGMQIANLKKNGPAALFFTFNETGEAVTGFQSYNQGIAVIPGNGNGGYGTPVYTFTNSSSSAINTNFGPQIVATADVNGDGNTDLVVISNSYVAATGPASQVQVYLGNGDGTFQAPINVNTPANPTSLVLADLNKDGKPDLAVICGAINAETDEVAIALGNGDGTFGAPTLMTIQSDINGYATLTAADFNGDGNVDLALFNYYGTSGIFYGNGDGTFTSVNTGGYVVPNDLFTLGVSGPAIATDLNGDGKPDILVGNTILINLYGAAPAALISTTTAITTPQTSVNAGTSVTLTATITAAAGSSGAPGGMVTFLDGNTLLGTGTVSGGVATYTTTTLPTGSDSITALYSGDTSFAGSASTALVVTVNTGPALVGTSTALAASPTSSVSGTSVTFTATVTPASGTVTPSGTITFTDSGTSIGTGSLNASGVATYSTTSLAVGSHSITAAYGGNASFAASTSSAVPVTITAPAPDFTFGISPGSGTETSSVPATATLTVTPENGFTGAVSFACTGLPASVGCSFSPATLTPAGSAITSTVTFAASAAANVQTHTGGRPAPLVSLAIGIGCLILARFRRYRALFSLPALVVLALLLLGLGACGGSSGSKTTTTTSTVTITATSGNTAHAATFTLTSSN